MKIKPMSAENIEDTCHWRFSEKMQPCPACGGWDLKYQTPIVMDEPVLPTDSARQILGKYARQRRKGLMMAGPAFIMCVGCGHKGPEMDCTGRSSDDVGQCAATAKEIRRLWNTQTRIGEDRQPPGS